MADLKAADILRTYESIFINYQELEAIEDEKAFEELLNLLVNHIKVLRNSCALGPSYQDLLISLPKFFDVLNSILHKNSWLDKYGSQLSIPLKSMTWQLAANICVQNSKTQTAVWLNLGGIVLSQLAEISTFTDTQLMLVYNIFKGGCVKDHGPIFKALIRICKRLLEPSNEEINLEFLHIFFEYFLTEYPRIVSLYGPLDASESITALQYMSSYISSGSSKGPILKSLMEYISKEFKKKSDCVLKTVESYLDNIHPQEVIALLDVISKASGEEMYSQLYSNDHSLFLNIGGLLQALNSIGSTSENIFTPMQKLEQVAPCSKINTDFEREISFEMKAMLVRALANLVYGNRKNQDYARDLGIIMAILNCTTVDARNPLIKEWSILAIRNLCENCPENQEFISKLCKVGEVPNDILSELSLELGTLRIKSSA